MKRFEEMKNDAKYNQIIEDAFRYYELKDKPYGKTTSKEDAWIASYEKRKYENPDMHASYYHYWRFPYQNFQHIPVKELKKREKRYNLKEVTNHYAFDNSYEDSRIKRFLNEWNSYFLKTYYPQIHELIANMKKYKGSPFQTVNEIKNILNKKDLNIFERKKYEKLLKEALEKEEYVSATNVTNQDLWELILDTDSEIIQTKYNQTEIILNGLIYLIMEKRGWKICPENEELLKYEILEACFLYNTELPQEVFDKNKYYSGKISNSFYPSNKKDFDYMTQENLKTLLYKRGNIADIYTIFKKELKDYPFFSEYRDDYGNIQICPELFFTYLENHENLKTYAFTTAIPYECGGVRNLNRFQMKYHEEYFQEYLNLLNEKQNHYGKANQEYWKAEFEKYLMGKNTESIENIETSYKRFRISGYFPNAKIKRPVYSKMIDDFVHFNKEIKEDFEKAKLFYELSSEEQEKYINNLFIGTPYYKEICSQINDMIKEGVSIETIYHIAKEAKKEYTSEEIIFDYQNCDTWSDEKWAEYYQYQDEIDNYHNWSDEEWDRYYSYKKRTGTIDKLTKIEHYAYYLHEMKKGEIFHCSLEELKTFLEVAQHYCSIYDFLYSEDYDMRGEYEVLFYQSYCGIKSDHKFIKVRDSVWGGTKTENVGLSGFDKYLLGQEEYKFENFSEEEGFLCDKKKKYFIELSKDIYNNYKILAEKMAEYHKCQAYAYVNAHPNTYSVTNYILDKEESGHCSHKNWLDTIVDGFRKKYCKPFIARELYGRLRYLEKQECGEYKSIRKYKNEIILYDWNNENYHEYLAYIAAAGKENELTEEDWKTIIRYKPHMWTRKEREAYKNWTKNNKHSKPIDVKYLDEHGID